ncbi:exported protein of unknown function [Nitrospira moscoviensis]|uniref:Uncharacterized protein n=1 Tax=Nitrospira moscoviensis TaxID=42253 RepID=A0A0K2GFQ9_NITMO|nr:exported protein of unknown function [Nitrospira moscoviensis]
MNQGRVTTVLLLNMVIMLVALFPAHFSISAWAHEDGERRNTASSSILSKQPLQEIEEGTDIPFQLTHSHETSLAGSCPDLENEADTAGLQHCVATLTNQISDLLRLIMNLSEALAESQNELLRGNHQGPTVMQPARPQS